jgi:hypothetical protein
VDCAVRGEPVRTQPPCGAGVECPLSGLDEAVSVGGDDELCPVAGASAATHTSNAGVRWLCCSAIAPSSSSPTWEPSTQPGPASAALDDRSAAVAAAVLAFRPPFGADRLLARQTRLVRPAEAASPREGPGAAATMTAWLVRYSDRSAQELRDLGHDPDDPGLIRLHMPDGTVRLPSFQFDDQARPHDIVIAVKMLQGWSRPGSRRIGCAAGGSRRWWPCCAAAGRSGEQRLRQHRVALPHPWVGGQVAIAHRGPDPQAAAALADFSGGQGGDVDEKAGVATPSLRWSTRLVPPPRNAASGSAAPCARRWTRLPEPDRRTAPPVRPAACATAGRMPR